ncbi:MULTISPECIES: membrane protein insertase YidC [unclassified Streptomyces]|uniref:YidC/Oxa1 family membrane protein insertase n=1 Tax=unclassified Streptomyces TaxID=2593676 RepID=UPI0008901A18|nr:MULTISPECIES: membrane protein insertase YidC [unclassified Streptomyces]PBC82605.1 YidC/Oxa1 family membrane protein insertase [Streptomyces sp. 2321.6]SDR48556.1 YidC/Oxa1 family membrane protein insertase [Streptomyces sp. KS_16]SEC64620.1 YidC/Oxa1 family membrane protein insertase [Streptomyces sp. 2133.1]SNC68681.1 YidC/Oxa1 family membrane protein insertase [Streptomyces sp. 2114.4]
MSLFGFLGDALAHGAAALAPLFGSAAMAAAIVSCTLGVRAALHPLARAAARGERARTALAPQLAALQRKHKGHPERLQKATSELYAETGSSPLAGCLPTLLQLPVFFVMYHLFSTGGGGLLHHTLLGAPLGGHWSQALADGGPFGPQGRVYLALFALIAAVATWNFRRARATMAKAPQPAAGAGAALPGTASMAKVMPLLSFGMLITVAVVPLAAGLYTVTTTIWTACERALLHRERERGEAAAATAAAPSGGKPARTKAKTVVPSGDQAPAPADGTPGTRTPQQGPSSQRPVSQRTDRRGGTDRRGAPKTRAARQRAARARANSQAGTGDRTPTGKALGKPTGKTVEEIATTTR